MRNRDKTRKPADTTEQRDMPNRTPLKTTSDDRHFHITSSIILLKHNMFKIAFNVQLFGEKHRRFGLFKTKQLFSITLLYIELNVAR